MGAEPKSPSATSRAASLCFSVIKGRTRQGRSGSGLFLLHGVNRTNPAECPRSSHCDHWPAASQLRLVSHAKPQLRRTLIAAGLVVVTAYLIAVIATRATQRTKNFPIADQLYQWPKGTTVLPPQPVSMAKDTFGIILTRETFGSSTMATTRAR